MGVWATEPLQARVHSGKFFLAMKTKYRYCSYNVSQIRESQLLTPERMAEVEAEIARRILPVFTASGKEIPNAKLVSHGDGTGYLHPRVEEEHQIEYAQRCAVAYVLTDAEFELVNSHCFDARNALMEAERFEKAEKVTECEHGVFAGDDYVPDISDLPDYYDDDDLPEYVWAAEPHAVVPGLDVSEILTGIIENNGWEDMDVHDFDGTTELQAALDAFVKANEKVVCFRPDYTKAVIVAKAMEGIA
jgi:hypothetical protein